MQIKHKINFDLRPYGKDERLQMIRIRASYSGVRLTLSTGCSIPGDIFWDAKSQLVVDGYSGTNGENAVSINNALRNCRDQMNTAFSYFEAIDKVPTIDELKGKYQERLKGIIPKKPDEPKRERKKAEPKLCQVFDIFVREVGVQRAWTDATYEKMSALRGDLHSFRPELKLSDMGESALTDFVVYLRDEKILRTPRKAKGDRKDYDEEDKKGLRNTTIGKKLDLLKWFLNWATSKGYNKNMAYKSFHPNLKTTQKKVIYLTEDEIKTLYNMKFDGATLFLEPVRDVFLFCCFTGLRHSDASNLRRHDVYDDHIEITTVKTADSISIELNDVSKAILNRYKMIEFPGNRALPSLNNQNFNRDLKTLCRLAGMTEKIRITTYKGSERHDEVKEKWQLVASHCGRRTFIVNALSMGIAPNVTMAWTGHSDYKAMKPYIAIVDEIKKEEMTKFNNLIAKEK